MFLLLEETLVVVVSFQLYITIILGAPTFIFTSTQSDFDKLGLVSDCSSFLNQ